MNQNKFEYCQLSEIFFQTNLIKFSSVQYTLQYFHEFSFWQLQVLRSKAKQKSKHCLPGKALYTSSPINCISVFIFPLGVNISSCNEWQFKSKGISQIRNPCIIHDGMTWSKSSSHSVALHPAKPPVLFITLFVWSLLMIPKPTLMTPDIFPPRQSFGENLPYFLHLYFQGSLCMPVIEPQNVNFGVGLI